MSIIIDICTHESPSNSSGGPFIWAQRIPLILRNLGYTVNFKLFAWNEPGDGPLSNFLRREGFNYSEKRITYTEDTVIWLLHQFRLNPPDVLIISLDIHSYYVIPWLKKAGIPVIGVIRSDEDYYHGIIDNFVFGKESFRVSAIVSVSKFLTKSIIDRKPENVFVKTIPSGTIVPTESASYSDEIFRIVYVGRIANKQKRIGELTRAFIRLTEVNKDINAYIIGGGPEEDEVKMLIEGSHTNNVHFLGNKSSSQIFDFLLKCQVIVLLSDYEGTPTSVMEGMACGCVPVCLNIRSGIPELVKHEKTGLLVEDRGESFINAIQRLKQDPEFFAKLSSNARSLIVNNFSTTVCAEKWSILIQSILINKFKRKVKIPVFLNLPPTNIFFSHQDVRKPSRILRAYFRLRIKLGRYKRMLFNRSSMQVF